MPPATGVKVTLDKERTLRYPMRALEHIEQETGKKLFTKGADNPFSSMGVSDLVTVIHAGLVHEDADVSRDVVLDHVDLQNMEEVTGLVFQAMGFEQDGGDQKTPGKTKAASAKKKS